MAFKICCGIITKIAANPNTRHAGTPIVQLLVVELDVLATGFSRAKMSEVPEGSFLGVHAMSPMQVWISAFLCVL